jgi:hypothetical protein
VLKDGDINPTPYVPDAVPESDSDDDSDDTPASEDDADSDPESVDETPDVPDPPEGFAAVGEEIACDFGEDGVHCGAVTEYTAFHVDWDDGLYQIVHADGDREQMSLEEYTSAWKHACMLDPVRSKPKKKPRKKKPKKPKKKKRKKAAKKPKPPPPPPRAQHKAGDTCSFRIDAGTCKGLDQVAAELGWDTSSMRKGGRSKKKTHHPR